jgi:hypothetical protein
MRERANLGRRGTDALIDNPCEGLPKGGTSHSQREISVAIMSPGVNTPALHVPINRGFAGVWAGQVPTDRQNPCL